MAPTDEVVTWYINPGRDARFWEMYREGSFASVFHYPAARSEDLGKRSRPELLAFVRELFDREGSKDDPEYQASAIWRFLHEMKVGDRIVAKDGVRRILGCGLVRTDYVHVSNAEQAHRRGVTWFRNYAPVELPSNLTLPRDTVGVIQNETLKQFVVENWPAKGSETNESGFQRSIEDEIELALKEAKIEAAVSARAILARANHYQEFFSHQLLEIRDVVMALRVAGSSSFDHLPTDPSVMFVDAYGDSADTLTSLSTQEGRVGPIQFTPALKNLLRLAASKQQRHFLNRQLGTKGIVAALISTRFGELEGEELAGEASFENRLQRFREIVETRLGGTSAGAQWIRALQVEVGGLPRLTNDHPGLGPPRDKLGIAKDALAIANVAAGMSTNLPLAIGVFGDWGSGKTFFMRLIQEQIARISSSSSEVGFEQAIVQIQFNAWHYAETNLWASLVSHIFDELDRWMTRDQKVGDVKTADQVLQRLATSRQLTLEAATELVQRRKEHSKAAQALAQAQQDLATAQVAAAHAPRTAWRAVLEVARNTISQDAELAEQLAATQVALNVPNLLEDKAKVEVALDELGRSTTAASASVSALRATIGNSRTILLAIVALVGIPILLYVSKQLLAAALNSPDLANLGTGVESVAGLLSMVAVLLHTFSGKVRSLAGKLSQLKQAVDVEVARATQQEEAIAATAVTTVAQRMADVDNARALVQATAAEVVAASKEYAEETGALRIRRFVRARASADGYGKHLGLVSTIRKDFEQLESLMLRREDPAPVHLEEARKHYESRVQALINSAGNALSEDEARQLQETTISLRDLGFPDTMVFRRIVLYIDDLDRCESKKVVEILQAVNMLLSFQLFVVIVAVDARWLARSLETEYPNYFKLDHQEAEPVVDQATTADYLEKIFQIPYWVPAMTSSTSATLVGDLVAADGIVEPGAPPAIVPATGMASEDAQPPIQGQEAEDDQPEDMEPTSRALRLTHDEINALTALAPFVGGSPRRARRFVNVYRVVKASLAQGEVEVLESGEYRALATQLAIASGAPNWFGSLLMACTTDEPNVLEQRIALIANQDKSGSISGALEAYRQMAGEGLDALGELAAQGNRAARFSFVGPLKQSSLAPTASE